MGTHMHKQSHEITADDQNQTSWHAFPILLNTPKLRTSTWLGSDGSKVEREVINDTKSWGREASGHGSDGERKILFLRLPYPFPRHHILKQTGWNHHFQSWLGAESASRVGLGQHSMPQGLQHQAVCMVPLGLGQALR